MRKSQRAILPHCTNMFLLPFNPCLKWTQVTENRLDVIGQCFPDNPSPLNNMLTTGLWVLAALLVSTEKWETGRLGAVAVGLIWLR